MYVASTLQRSTEITSTRAAAGAAAAAPHRRRSFLSQSTLAAACFASWSAMLRRAGSGREPRPGGGARGTAAALGFARATRRVLVLMAGLLVLLRVCIEGRGWPTRRSAAAAACMRVGRADACASGTDAPCSQVHFWSICPLNQHAKVCASTADEQ